MTTTLVLVACLYGDPQNCRRERILTTGGFATAPQIIAEWVGEHVGYRVVEWRVRL